MWESKIDRANIHAVHEFKLWGSKLNENKCHKNFYSSFKIFKKLLNTGMAAMATTFLYLEDVSWPDWCLCQASTWLASKEQNYCRVFVFSLFRVFVFQLFKMLENTGMVAKATKFLCLEDVYWCLYQVSAWLASKEQNYCRVFVFSLFRVFVFQLFKMLGNTDMVAKVTEFLCLEDVFWPNWCL